MAFGAVAWGFAAADVLRAEAPAAIFESVDAIADLLVGERP
jgi:hypothetical protein